MRSGGIAARCRLRLSDGQRNPWRVTMEVALSGGVGVGVGGGDGLGCDWLVDAAVAKEELDSLEEELGETDSLRSLEEPLAALELELDSLEGAEEMVSQVLDRPSCGRRELHRASCSRQQEGSGPSRGQEKPGRPSCDRRLEPNMSGCRRQQEINRTGCNSQDKSRQPRRQLNGGSVATPGNGRPPITIWIDVSSSEDEVDEEEDGLVSRDR